ncbi:cell division control protein cdc6-like protein [Haloferax gibbonsii ATCC 33959]|uniref:Cell division control protein cdc6-like protein n=1 Tax=Haloferax gibbonsii (strain ATCC 33959 / DSM 4427 / JCM 8863 / NBRC 102184 / NCIMB 2188 / Ma 2.38) TaxID=1227459 RepID=M0H8M8_HALGM|nr:AAA family ATPase [Haloferax gibbonsii]ELZ80153.1 cell division control protein cdc6-like protein [Haloferax gibbonsii ATCC 33959]
MKLNVIKDTEPLQLDYRPEVVVNRKKEYRLLNSFVEMVSAGESQNLLLHGSRGTGKTLLLRKTVSQLESVNLVWVSCRVHDTQYKVLKQISEAVTGKNTKTGLHTSEYQRTIQERTTQVQTLVVLDEIEFLLLNNGNDLLYYLSRTNPDKLSVALTYSSSQEFSELVEERTYSTLYPETLELEPYSTEEVYQILAERARLSLKPRSLQHEALSYISETIRNPAIGLYWLKITAEHVEDAIHAEDVKACYESGLQSYVYEQLEHFSEHHKLLYQAIEELSKEETTTSSGKVYKQYQQLCKAQSKKPLSDRRISDHLKQLEKLDLIQAKYHYGGRKGKSREIRLSNRSVPL